MNKKFTKVLGVILSLAIVLSMTSFVAGATETRNAYDWIMCVDNDIASEVNHATKVIEHEGEKVVSSMWDAEYLGYSNVVFDRQPTGMEFIAKTSLDAAGKQYIWNQKNFYVYIDGTAEENKLATFTIKVLDDHFTTCTAEITKEIDINVPHTIYFSSPSGYSYANSYKKFRFTSGKDASQKINAYPFSEEKSTIVEDSIVYKPDDITTSFAYKMEHNPPSVAGTIAYAGSGAIFAYEGVRFPKVPDFVEADFTAWVKGTSGVEIYVDELTTPVARLASTITGTRQTISAEFNGNIDITKEHTVYLKQINRGIDIHCFQFLNAKDSDVLWPKPYDEAIITNPDVYNANYGKTYGIVETGGSNYYTYKYVYFPKAVKSFDVLYYNHNGGTGTKAIWLYLDGATSPTFEIAVPNSGNSETKVLYKNAPSAYKKAAPMTAEIPAGYHTLKLWIANGVEVYGFDFDYAENPYEPISASRFDKADSHCYFINNINVKTEASGTKIDYAAKLDLFDLGTYDFSEAPDKVMLRCSYYYADTPLTIEVRADAKAVDNVITDNGTTIATVTGTTPSTSGWSMPVDYYADITTDITGVHDIAVYLKTDVHVYDLQFFKDGQVLKASETLVPENKTATDISFKAVDFTDIDESNIVIDGNGTYTLYIDAGSKTASASYIPPQNTAGTVTVNGKAAIGVSGLTGLHTVRLVGSGTLNSIKFAENKLAYNADTKSLDVYATSDETGVIIVTTKKGNMVKSVETVDAALTSGSVLNIPLGDAFIGDASEINVYFWTDAKATAKPIRFKKTLSIK